MSPRASVHPFTGQRLDESPAARPQQTKRSLRPAALPVDGDDRYVTTRKAIEIIGCDTLKAAYAWLHRHGIVRRQNGTMSERAIRRALSQRSQRGRSAGSQAQWFRRKSA